MANNGTTTFPGSIDVFDNPGTQTFEDDAGYYHDLLHAQIQDAAEAIENTIGTTAGTSVLKNVLAGQFVATTAGTETLINKGLEQSTNTFTNLHKARAFVNAAQNNLTDATWTKVVLDGENYDLNNNFDSTTNYRYTIPATGYYHIHGQVTYVNQVANKTYVAGIFADEGTSLLAASYSNNGSDVTNQLSVNVFWEGSLSATQTINLRCLVFTGVATVDIQAGGAYTYLEIERIP